jgi:hypothetical protein
VSEDKIVDLRKLLEAKVKPEQRASMAEILGTLARTIRELRRSGATSKDMAQALRMAANDLDHGNEPA